MNLFDMSAEVAAGYLQELPRLVARRATVVHTAMLQGVTGAV